MKAYREENINTNTRLNGIGTFLKLKNQIKTGIIVPDARGINKI
jgi:hypothetical protein